MTIGHPARLVTVALALIAWPCGESMAAALDALGTGGVYTWRVAATDDAPPWCCVCWMSRSPVARACDLDGRHSNYSAGDERPAPNGEMQIYALIESGKTQRIRVLHPQCAVTSRRDIVDLGVVEVDESLAWLEDHVTPATSLSSDALAAIAVHRGAAALRFLVDTADAGPTMELRKEAAFWMSQARISEAAGELERLMFHDASAEMRQHAAFSLSQSTAENRADALIRQGREDNDPEVRSQAWFWLAQTGASESEQAIQWAIANDRDNEVREEAVFAMSQLPGERAVDALFAVLGNRQLQREVREQALFWLVQSDSDRAFEYVDRLLSGGR
ncbi:MAG: HEAT repeat domain-containing protein [Woeseiaceae bacterium]